MNRRNVSIICIALYLILLGGYILRQNYLLGEAYKSVEAYDYIPAEESKTILEITPGVPIDSLVPAVPILQKAHAIDLLWQKICQSAKIPDNRPTIATITESGEIALWYKVSRKEQHKVKESLPRLLSNDYPPVKEAVGKITVKHYALQNGTFLHTLTAPGVVAFSLNGSLFREAQQTIDYAGRREHFANTLHSLDPEASARLLRQIPGKNGRSSGRWEGKSIYTRTTGAETIPSLPTDSLP